MLRKLRAGGRLEKFPPTSSFSVVEMTRFTRYRKTFNSSMREEQGEGSSRFEPYTQYGNVAKKVLPARHFRLPDRLE